MEHNHIKRHMIMHMRGRQALTQSTSASAYGQTCTYSNLLAHRNPNASTLAKADNMNTRARVAEDVCTRTYVVPFLFLHVLMAINERFCHQQVDCRCFLTAGERRGLWQPRE